MTLGNKLRFEVFKRDNFTCQYCGRKTPEIILEVDHIVPRSKGGIDEIENLITSCFECNRGKSNKSLTEPTKRIRKNIKDIKEKKEQMEAFYKYQKSIDTLQDKMVEELSNYWNEIWNYDYELTTQGKLSIKRFLKFFSIPEIKEAMGIALRIKNVNGSFKYMCRILHNKKCGILHNKKREKYGQETDN